MNDALEYLVEKGLILNPDRPEGSIKFENKNFIKFKNENKLYNYYHVFYQEIPGMEGKNTFNQGVELYVRIVKREVDCIEFFWDLAVAEAIETQYGISTHYDDTRDKKWIYFRCQITDAEKADNFLQALKHYDKTLSMSISKYDDMVKQFIKDRASHMTTLVGRLS